MVLRVCLFVCLFVCIEWFAGQAGGSAGRNLNGADSSMPILWDITVNLNEYRLMMIFQNTQRKKKDENKKTNKQKTPFQSRQCKTKWRCLYMYPWVTLCSWYNFLNPTANFLTTTSVVFYPPPPPPQLALVCGNFSRACIQMHPTPSLSLIFVSPCYTT